MTEPNESQPERVGTGKRPGESAEERRERMRELARRSNEARKRNKAEREAAAAPGSGSGAAVEERDRAAALKEMRRLLKSPTTKDADKVAAARILAGAEEDKKVGRPPSVEALRSLSTEELEALVLAHC